MKNVHVVNHSLLRAKISKLRDKTTLKPVAYYENLPLSLDRSERYVLDPMLATGGSAVYCLPLIKEYGGANITLFTIFSTPEGMELVRKNYPDVKIVTVSLDWELNGHGYILPGLGAAGERLNGTD